MKAALVFLLLLIASTALFSQAPAEYYRYLKIADSLYKTKSYLQSAKTFQMAFNSFGRRGYTDDRYNAACSWAMAGVPDTAFAELSHISKNGFDNSQRLLNDSDLIILHNDKRWSKLLELVAINHTGKKPALRRQINAMCGEDQKWLNLMVRSWNALIPTDSLSESAIRSKIDSLNKSHYVVLRKIVRRHGFPNQDEVGFVGAQNFWVLVQHQDNHPDFQQKVLNRMKKEVDRKKASLSNYAYLTDRVKVNTGQLQIYGTQMQLNKDSTSYEPLPVFEPEKLNERRNSVGLDAIEKYTDTMNHINRAKLRKKNS